MWVSFGGVSNILTIVAAGSNTLPYNTFAVRVYLWGIYACGSCNHLASNSLQQPGQPKLTFLKV